jgi:hypothetical protein
MSFGQAATGERGSSCLTEPQILLRDEFDVTAIEQNLTMSDARRAPRALLYLERQPPKSMDFFSPPSDQRILVGVLPIVLQPAFAKGELVLGGHQRCR